MKNLLRHKSILTKRSLECAWWGTHAFYTKRAPDTQNERAYCDVRSGLLRKNRDRVRTLTQNRSRQGNKPCMVAEKRAGFFHGAARRCGRATHQRMPSGVSRDLIPYGCKETFLCRKKMEGFNDTLNCETAVRCVYLTFTCRF